MRANELVELIKLCYNDDEDVIFKIISKEDVDIHADTEEWTDFVDEVESRHSILDEFNTAIDYAFTEWKEEQMWS